MKTVRLDADITIRSIDDIDEHKVYIVQRNTSQFMLVVAIEVPEYQAKLDGWFDKSKTMYTTVNLGPAYNWAKAEKAFPTLRKCIEDALAKYHDYKVYEFNTFDEFIDWYETYRKGEVNDK